MTKSVGARISPGSSETPTRNYRLIAERNDRGFPIAEVAVVIVIFGILASMALPQLISSLTVATSNAGRQEMRDRGTQEIEPAFPPETEWTLPTGWPTGSTSGKGPP